MTRWREKDQKRKKKSSGVPIFNRGLLKKSYLLDSGFFAEYIFSKVSVASKTRVPIYVPPFSKLSCLPLSLYPYNFSRKDQNFQLFQEFTDPQDKNKIQFIPLKPGERNQKLFEFLGVADFGENHIYTTNYLCCDPAKPMSDLISMNKRTRRPPKNFHLKKTLWKIPFNNFEHKISKPTQGTTNFAGGFSDPADVWMLETRELWTPTDTINFVEFIENQTDFFFPNDEWMGNSLEKVIVFYLSDQKGFKAKYHASKFTWLISNDPYWEPIM